MTTTTYEHRYTPRGTARRLFSCKQPEVLIGGAAGTGKSRACLEKLHLMAMKYPRMRGLIVRKTLASLTSTALVTWRNHVVDRHLESGEVWFYGGSSEEPAQYRYKNGSQIVVAGMDRSTRVMSSEYDVVYVQEATELIEDDWEALSTRLRNGRVPYQQIIADCNPDKPTHWLKLRCDAGKTLMLESRHEENPVYYNADGTVTDTGRAYMAKLDNLTGVRYMRLRKGLWVAAEGIIYDDYDPAIHLVNHFDPPHSWPRIWTVDFGYTNPFVCQHWAEDPDGRLWMYREFYMTQRTVDRHAADILKVVRGDDGSWIEPKPQAIVCDHDAEGRAVLQRELGLPTINANKAVIDGIQAMQRRLRKAGDGKPRMYLMRDSLVERDQQLVDKRKPTCTPEEMPGYVWDTGGGKKLKETPLKEDDHGCDGGRYVVAYKDLKSEYSVRRL